LESQVSPDRSRATSLFLDLFQLTPGRPDVRRLGEISYRFAGLPWENLTKYLRKHVPAGPDRLARLPAPLGSIPGTDRLRLPDEVMEDHARHGTGGTCFSLTHSLRTIVTDLGYRARPVMADMKNGKNVHCGLVVVIGGARWLLDPGYLVAEPVPLRPGETACVVHPGTTLEYRPAGDGCRELYTVNDRGETTFRYRLRERPVSDRDFVQYWLDSFETPGMNGLHLNRIAGGVRLSAHDLNLRIDTGRDKSNVKLRTDYVERVSERFGVDPGLARRAYDEWSRQRCRNR